MIDESGVVDLVISKLWQPVKSKYRAVHEALVPYSEIYVILGRRGFCKSETRQLGKYFQSKGLLTIAKHGWLIKENLK